MNLMELVKSRRSVRTFDGKAPAREEVRDLLKYADEAGNPSSGERERHRVEREPGIRLGQVVDGNDFHVLSSEEFDLYEYRTVWLHLHPPTELGRFEQFRLASVAFGGCTACGRACDARQPL